MWGAQSEISGYFNLNEKFILRSRSFLQDFTCVNLMLIDIPALYDTMFASMNLDTQWAARRNEICIIALEAPGMEGKNFLSRLPKVIPESADAVLMSYLLCE